MDFQVRIIPDLQSMIIVSLILLVLFLVYKKLLHKPVSQFLQERKDFVRLEISDAKLLKEEALILEQNQREILSKAQLEGQQIVESARIFGEEVKESIIVEAKNQARGIIAKAEREASRQKTIAMEEMKNESIEMAVLIASKILEERISIDKQNTLIDKFILEVGKSQWLN